MGAINSSGTSSGLNLAGVTQGKLSFTGKRVTITSPLSTKNQENALVTPEFNQRSNTVTT